jgi:hypothetical protein
MSALWGATFILKFLILLTVLGTRRYDLLPQVKLY